MNSNNFKSIVEQEAFTKVSNEFGIAFFFWFILIITSVFLFGIHLPQKEKITCNMETIKKWKAKDHFYENGKYFDLGGAQSKKYFKSGAYSFELGKGIPFGLNYTIPRLEGNEKIKASIWRFSEKKTNKSNRIVAEVKGGLFWKSGNEIVEKSKDGWEKIQFTFEPPSRIKSKKLDIYVWNEGDDSVWFDDLEIIIERI